MSIISSEICCILQVALLGFVTPNLRAVIFYCHENDICLIFYYDQSPSENELELASLADTEFISNLSSCKHKTEYKIITLPYPKPIPKDGTLVYLRYEPTFIK